jgi:hypothetical protein
MNLSKQNAASDPPTVLTVCAGKPLKRFPIQLKVITGLKPGENKKRLLRQSLVAMLQ